jgi:CRP/FNR family transcriptional regulator, cyclic AMP receptor protein
MANRAIQRFVAECDLFSGLAPELIGFLAEHAVAKRLKADDVLFRHGDDARHFYLIAEGSVSVEVAALEGPPLELQELGPGAVLGWSWLIAPYKWSFQARATAPTEVVEFDGTAILARCDKDPLFGYELMKRFSALMSERLRFARQKMMEEWKPAGYA